MVNPLYHVYLSRSSTTPENWDTENEADCTSASGWLKFICPLLDDGFKNLNTHKHMAGHTSYRIVAGKMMQFQSLSGCVITKTDGATSSDYYNKVKEFILRHTVTGAANGYDLFLHVYDPSGNGGYIKWMDKNEIMQSHCQINVKGFNFRLDHSGVYKGNIVIEEVQDA